MGYSRNYTQNHQKKLIVLACFVFSLFLLFGTLESQYISNDEDGGINEFQNDDIIDENEIIEEKKDDETGSSEIINPLEDNTTSLNDDTIQGPVCADDYSEIMEYYFTTTTSLDTYASEAGQNYVEQDSNNWNLTDEYGSPFVGGELLVKWSATVTDNSELKWQYKINDGSWNDIPGGDFSGINFTNKVDYLDLRDLNLQGDENSVQIRCWANLENINSGTPPFYDDIEPSIVEFDNVTTQIFTSSFSDNSTNGNYANLEEELGITVNIHRFGQTNGDESNLSETDSDYKIYYTTDGSLPDQSSNNNIPVSSDAFSDNYNAEFNYTISVSENSTINYRLGISVPSTSFIYWGPNFTVSMYDGIFPEVDQGSVSINGGDSYMYYNNVSVSADISDAGGMSLQKAEIFWKMGGSDVSRSEYDSFSVNSTIDGFATETLYFEIPKESLDPYEATSVIIYLYDGSYNMAQSNHIYLYPQDDTDPIITYKSNSSDNDEIGYEVNNFRIEYNFSTGNSKEYLNSDSAFLRWSINSTPFDAEDYDESIKINLGDGLSSAEGEFPLEGINVSKRFGLDDVVRFWTVINDSGAHNTLEHTQSSHDSCIMFTIVDKVAPFYQEVINVKDVNYTDTQNFRIRFYEPLGAAGLLDGSIHLYYRINQSNWDPNSATKLSGTDDENIYDQGNLYSREMTFSISHEQLNYQDEVYIFINMSDTYNNCINGSDGYQFHFTVIDGLAPELSVVQGYFDTNLTFARTHYDLMVSLNANDIPHGSGLKNISLAYQMNSDFTWNLGEWSSTGSIIYKNESDQISDIQSINQIQFILSKENITNGTLYLKVRAYDKDGNSFDYEIVQEIIEQVDHPVYVDYSLGESANNYLNVQSFTFTLEINNNSLMFLYLDGVLQNEIPYSGTLMSHAISGLDEGEHSIRVQYYNVSDGFYQSFTIDLTAPNAISKESISIEYNEEGQIFLSWNPPEGDESSDLEYYIFRGDSPEFDVNAGGVVQVGKTSDTQYSYNPTGTGTFYYKIVARDKAGNFGAASSSVSLEITTPNYGLIFGAVGGVVGALGLGYFLKSRKTEDEFLKGGDVKDKDLIEEEDDVWGEDEQDDLEWEDISSSYSESAQTRVSKQQVKAPEVTHVEKGGKITDANISARLDGELLEMYENAQEFTEMGQDSMAIQSYEMLIRKAEKRGNQRLVDFIQKKIDEIY